MNGRLHPRRAKTAALAFLLAFALLVCHGAMGSLHLPSEAAIGSSASHTSHKGHDSGGDGGLLSAHHESEVEYFAVLSLFFLAALLFLLRPKFERLPARVAAAGVYRLSNTMTPHLPRGPTLGFLQVFRL